MAERVGFVGLGVMGAPMAGHLVRAGHNVTVWNRTPSKSEPLREAGAFVAPNLERLAESCTLVFLCVGRTEDVQACLAPMAASAAAGTLFVDHSTISPSATVEIEASLRAMGLGFVDAPITGGSMGAQSGQLTVFCGGDAALVERARPAMTAYAKRIERVGGPGAGQTTKMANQIAVAGSLLGLCEALSFANKAGLDVALTRELISGGAAGSWALENYGPKILAEDWSPGFSIANQRKDFGYCRETAEAVDAAIPGTLLVDDLLRDLEREGHGDWATAALYERLLRMGAAE
jgi:3-hydroxyisobutyrate dehydrogenase